MSQNVINIGFKGPDLPDSEYRWPIEPAGFHLFAWLPKRCRNGRIRWLCWLERHGPGDFTLSRGG
jgi:hypothetical protein